MQLKILAFNARLLLQSLFGGAVRRALGPHVRALVVDSELGRFAVDPEDNGVGGRLRYRGSYGKEEVELAASLIAPESRVLVVGAHVGTLAIPLAKRCAGVTAVEANPRTRELLEMNLALNGISNLDIVGHAASDRAETIRFRLARNNSGNSKRSTSKRMFWDYYERAEVIEVPADRLDVLLPDGRYDLVIMDVEGSEQLAIRGMPRILGEAKALVVEFMPLMMRTFGDDAEGFVAAIEPHFARMFVPGRGETVERARFREVLNGMFRRNETEAGLLFTKD